MSKKPALLKFKSEEEVMQHYLADKENHQVVIFEGAVIDVKEYAPDHPGGEQYLTDRLGKDIVEDFEDAEHTRSAKNLLKELPVVGHIVEDTADKESTDSQKDDLSKQKKDYGGANALYGMKFNDAVNKKINADYNKGLTW